ncbi:MAG: hypothetical protein V1653_00610, partial [bacterium]
MLYEADKSQFNELIKEWNSYVKEGQVNLVVGNQVDWEVHQTTVNPAGPEEFYNRLVRGATQIYQDSPVKGIFCHDLSRIIWGRIGPYSSLEWAVAGGTAFSQLRLKSSTISLSTIVIVPEQITEGKIFTVEVPVKNLSHHNIDQVTVELLHTPGITCLDNNKKIITNLEAGSEVKITYSIKVCNGAKRRHSRYMIATLANWTEKGKDEKYFSFSYVQANNNTEQPKETNTEEIKP